MQNQILTVSELSRQLKQLIESYIPPVSVEGEISNFSQSRAGHIYFSLKDQNALIKCVIWKNIAYSLPFNLQDGMHAMVQGEVTTYPNASTYQITVRQVRPAGIGALYMAYEALKQRLSKEGLFDPALKKPLPKYPKRIGVVTSATGAAIQDILRISERRNPAVQMVIYPAVVQGAGGADTIVAGIRYFNQAADVDLIIIGRGGGSLEDLWNFNEEKVVREVVASEIPIVSAVGHEVDVSLSDYAADLTVPTPSAAAEMTIPERTEILAWYERLADSLRNAVLQVIQKQKTVLDFQTKRLGRVHPENVIRQNYQRLDDVEIRMTRAIHQNLKSKNLRLKMAAEALAAYSPELALKRGYALVYDKETKKLIKHIDEVSKEQKLTIQVADGKFNVGVTDISKK